MFMPLSLTKQATACTGWPTDRTGFFQLLDLAGMVSFKASPSVVLHRRSRCSATLTDTCQQKKTCEIWSGSRNASALSYLLVCGAITVWAHIVDIQGISAP